MAPKRRPKRAEKSFCLIPSQHDDVSALLEEDDLSFSFHDEDNLAGCDRECDTYVEGRFVCRNNACEKKGRVWYSVRIATTIRTYPGAEYNARVYKQRCGICQALGHPLLKKGSSYAEMVAYRIKTWCGVDAKPPQRAPYSRAQHCRELCEGCKAGHC